MSLPLKSAPDDEQPCLRANPLDRARKDESLDQESSPQTTTEISLGASESLARFFESIAPQAKRFAMSMTRRWCEAEELVQESFFRIAKAESAADTLDQVHLASTSSRKSYLFTTIRNLAIDRIRTSKRRPQEQRELDSLAGPKRRLESEQTRSLQQLETSIDASLETMPTQWAEALKLKINGELTYGEIAEVLEATTDQVRGWIYRARKQLANELNQQGLLGDDS